MFSTIFAKLDLLLRMCAEANVFVTVEDALGG